MQHVYRTMIFWEKFEMSDNADCGRQGTGLILCDNDNRETDCRN